MFYNGSSLSDLMNSSLEGLSSSLLSLGGSVSLFQFLRPSGSSVSSSNDPVPSTNSSYVVCSLNGRSPARKQNLLLAPCLVQFLWRSSHVPKQSSWHTEKPITCWITHRISKERMSHYLIVQPCQIYPAFLFLITSMRPETWTLDFSTGILIVTCNF